MTCQYTRPELEKLLADSGYGANQPMFNTYFRQNPAGGPPLCATCGQPLGAHGGAAPQTIIVQGGPGVDVHAKPAGITMVNDDPMLERTADSGCKVNNWWLLLLHLGLVPLCFSAHKTHLEFDHRAKKVKYVKDFMCCPCQNEQEVGYGEVPELQISASRGRAGKGRAPHAYIFSEGPDGCCCDAECGKWAWGATDPFNPDVQQAHKQQWQNYLLRSFNTAAPELPAAPGSAGAEPSSHKQAW